MFAFIFQRIKETSQVQLRMAVERWKIILIVCFKDALLVMLKNLGGWLVRNFNIKA